MLAFPDLAFQKLLLPICGLMPFGWDTPPNAIIMSYLEDQNVPITMFEMKSLSADLRITPHKFEDLIEEIEDSREGILNEPLSRESLVRINLGDKKFSWVVVRKRLERTIVHIQFLGITKTEADEAKEILLQLWNNVNIQDCMLSIGPHLYSDCLDESGGLRALWLLDHLRHRTTRIEVSSCCHLYNEITDIWIRFRIRKLALHRDMLAILQDPTAPWASEASNQAFNQLKQKFRRWS